MKNVFLLSFLLFGSGWLYNKCYAQLDTSYYVTYPQKVVGRAYLSKKFTALGIQNSKQEYHLNYLPNTTLNFGIGATYRWATLNLAYGFGFLNPSHDRGKTKYLDLQFHSYGRRIVLDLFGQFYRGFYLAEKKYKSADRAYYIRPDLRVNLIGTSVQYVFNNRKFSYRASFLQNEWQKKSAGTFLIGLESYFGWIKADSAIIPGLLIKDNQSLHPDRLNFFEVGPNAGYAYTFVFKKHFYVTGSVSASLDYGRVALGQMKEKERSAGFSSNTFLRLFAGYNSDTWSVNMVYVIDNIRMVSGQGNRNIFLKAGNYRLNFAYRFKPSKKARKVLKVVDEVEESVEENLEEDRK